MGMNLSTDNGDITANQVGSAPINVHGTYVENGSYSGSGNQSNGDNANLVTGLLGGLLGGLSL